MFYSNKATIAGNLADDPVVRAFDDGSSIANITIAVNNNYKNKNGERVESTDFVRCVARSHAATFAGNYLKKGDPVVFVGAVKTRKYQDRDGSDRYATEVVGTEISSQGRNATSSQASSDSRQPSPGYQPASAGYDDEIPF